MSAAPKRKKTAKPDRLLAPDVTVIESKIHFTLAPLARVESEMNIKWGQERLASLVALEMAGKYGECIGKLNAAINAGDPELVAQWVGVCIRGLAAMDAAATKAGHKSTAATFWEYEVPPLEGKDAFRFAVLKDPADRAKAQEARPDLRFYDMREVGIAIQLKMNTPLIAAAKDTFPGAVITKIKPAVDYAAGGDQIPF